MTRVAHIPTFGAGWVQEGAADQQRSDEVLLADGYDIGSRGALVATRDPANYLTINDLATAPGPWSKLHALGAVAGANYAKEIAIGEGLSVATPRYLMGAFLREGQVSPLGGPTDVILFGAPSGGAVPAPLAAGVIVTVAQFPGTYALYDGAAAAVKFVNVFLVNLGAREGSLVNTAPGLYVVYAIPTSSDLVPFAINYYGSLGTGPRFVEADGTTHVAGSKAKQLFFRGVSAYNGFAMGWGHNEKDTNKEGPARLMFSNLANPLRWGNDNQAASGDRDFTDSDAVDIGDSGEAIRAGLSWRKRFWIGTDQKMHFLAGYGRDSFITDGANPVAKAENVIGAHCMIEGPDGLLYGVGSNGLWAFDEATFERHHRRLRKFARAAPGAWDLIWTDRALPDTYPGKTNADLVWMAVDWDSEQVLTGIPWCNASSGTGYGLDTVVIKFHPRTGGFSRQVFLNRQFTAADYPRAQRQWSGTRFFGTTTAAQVTVQKYGQIDATSGQLPSPLPETIIGPYALIGPDGVGVNRRVYPTIAWEEPAGATVLSTWVDRISAVRPASLYDTVYGSNVGRFVSIGYDAGPVGAVETSSDGITWTARAAANANGWQAVCYSPELALYVAVAKENHAGHQVMTSPDGIVWTARVEAVVSTWCDVCWSKELALFIAVDGAGGQVMTSPTGVVWTLSSGGLGDVQAVCWSAERALVVLVGTNNVVTSPDAVAWTSRTPANGNQWIDVCWAPAIHRYVAVSKNGTGNQIMVSLDGASWAAAITPSPSYAWRAILWAPENNLLVVVGADGSANSAYMYSATGATWTAAQTLPGHSMQLEGLAWNGTTFVAVGNDVGGAQIQTSTIATVALQFLLTPICDDATLTAVRLTINATAPGSPADGDVWVDTSQTDTNLGNGTAGAITPALGGYIVRRWHNDRWELTGVGGQKGQRVTVPIAFGTLRGTRFSCDINCVSANRRYQLEGFGFAPVPVGETT